MNELIQRTAPLSASDGSVAREALRQEGRQIESVPHKIRQGPFPLSFAQERLWFLEQLVPNSAVHNLPVAARLDGELDLTAFHRSLEAIVQRHEVLRSRYEAHEGHPVQVVTAPAGLEVPLVDLSDVAEPQRNDRVRVLCAMEAQRPFDLTQDLMLRARLFRLSPREHVLMLTLHHIAGDDCSLELLLAELWSLYQAFCTGEVSPLPKLPFQYADFAVWQREWLRGEVLEKQLEYWRKQLNGAPAMLELPMALARPAIQSYRGSLEQATFSMELMRAVMALGEQEGASLFMVLLAAFQALLYRYSCGEDIVVGAPTPGRNRKGIEGLIGLFSNTLVLRGNMSGSLTFRELLRRLREEVLGAYAHQDVPFEKLVQELQPERNLSYSPICQVVFGLQKGPVKAANAGGLKVRWESVSSGTSRFDLAVYVTETAGGLKAVAEYNTDLFEAQSIKRLLGHYRTLLESIVAKPDKRVGSLALLPEAERHQLVVEWNRTEAEYTKNACIHELLEAQVDRTPETVAVVFEGQQLTYRQLNRRANQLAGALQTFGVRPGALVALYVERSLEMVVGLLGILKAGGAYVPLDPMFPRERLALMIEDARPLALLTQERLRGQIPPHQAQVVCVDALQTRGEYQRWDNGKPQASDLAYVLYTSGSTTKPKGVQIPHRAVVNFLCSMRRKPGMNQADTLLAVTTLSFDIAGMELFLPLITGARVVIASSEVARDGTRLASLFKQCQATVMQATPATWRLLLEAGWEGSSHLKILCGGEAWSTELASQLLRRCESLWNMYGPTETTIWSSVSKVEAGKPVVIGPPIANTTFYILDACQHPVPVGVPGELYIGGDGLAQGYLNRAELTSERFVSDPFSAVPEARLYRTGDRLRYLPDGNLEFFGRIDFQVKVRGFRIELGEIESALQLHPSVREAVVVVREDVPGEKRLVAYLRAATVSPATVEELSGFLKEKLPSYMQPSAWMWLEAFPLTLNGKINRKALPAPESGEPSLAESYVASRTRTEEKIARIWSELFGLKQVGVEDNFFELGGHSITGVRLLALIEKQFGRRLPLTALFQSPTISEFCRLLEKPDGQDKGFHLFGSPSLGNKRALFCFHFLSGAQRLSKHLLPKIQVCGIDTLLNEDLRQFHESGRINTSVKTLASRCLTTMRQVQARGPYYLSGFCFGGVLAFEIACQLALLGEKVGLLAIVDAIYYPGCTRMTAPQIRRWTHHARKGFSEGPRYLWKKLLTSLQVESRRRSKLKRMRLSKHLASQDQPEELRLPQARFLEALLKSYKGQSYSGSAVLVRTAAEPSSFEMDVGRDCGWHTVVLGGVKLEEVPCGHLDMSEEPYVGEVARRLRYYL